MKVIITGLNGTVAPVVAEYFAQHGISVIPWNRSIIPTDNKEKINEFVSEVAPHWFLHIATGDPWWAKTCANVCYQHHIKFLYTSSVSVFSANVEGPFSISQPPNATDDYGRYKIECESSVTAANPEVLIARLGWQIGSQKGSNNMMDFILSAIEKHGHIEASSCWYPACSFLDDTAQTLLQLMQKHDKGIYHIDGNPGFSFFKIVSSLNKLHQGGWNINETYKPSHNSRLLDANIQTASISNRLPP